MQIHELNNFSGTLGSGSYLPIDNGTDTGKISTQQLLSATEARIDNIIAGDAPSAAEVTDARYGADGVTYTSLGTAIRTQVSDLKAGISSLWNPKPQSASVTFTAANQEKDTTIKLIAGTTYYIRTTTNIGNANNLRVYAANNYSGANKDLIKNNYNELTPTGSGVLRIFNRPSNSFIGTVTLEVMPKFAEDAFKNASFLSSTTQFASLDDIKTNSIYSLTSGYSSGDAAGTTHTNTPIQFRGTPCYVMTFKFNDPSGDYRTQIAFEPNRGMCFMRKTNSGVMGAWAKSSLDSMGFLQSVSTYASLDDINENGIWLVSSAYAIGDVDGTTATNTPRELIGRAWELISVNATDSGTYRFQMAVSPETGEIFLRKTVYGEWDDWHNVMANDSIEWQLDFSNYSDTWTEEWNTQESIKGRPNLVVCNKGIDLKVVSYNVAGYRYDGGGSYLITKPERLLNLRKFIAQADSDIMLIQEEKGYIDSLEELSASKALYYDRLSYNSKYYGTNIRAKYPAHAKGQVEVKKLTNSDIPISGEMYDRYFTWGMINIEGKEVLAISCHPMNSSITFSNEPSVGPEANRLNFLKIVYDFIFCMHDENIINGLHNDVTRPWDYVVIGGDFNTTNINGKDSSGVNYDGNDWENFAELRDYYMFDSANGGYLNWFVTYPSYSASSRYGALDNILVSGNAIINSIDCKTDLFRKLHSDHLPVEASITLLDDELNPEINERFPTQTYEGKSAENNLNELRAWLSLVFEGTVETPCL